MSSLTRDAGLNLKHKLALARDLCSTCNINICDLVALWRWCYPLLLNWLLQLATSVSEVSVSCSLNAKQRETQTAAVTKSWFFH